MCTYIFGHKNPDTDSVMSAISFSYLKNQMNCSTIPCVLGNINKESQYVLDYFDIEPPKYLKNVKTQVKDLLYDKVEGISPQASILHAYKKMTEDSERTYPVVDERNKLLGLITMNDIAMGLIKGDFTHLHTSLSNIAHDLEGELLVGKDQIITGKISVMAYIYQSVEGSLTKDKIIIVGDRYDIIEYAIESKVKLIIITGYKKVPHYYIDLAQKNNVPMILIPSDTYTVSKLMNQCNYISSIMKKTDLIQFNENEYLEDIKEEMINSSHINYPVVDDHNTFLGFINRRHILKPNRKKVMLVDHNEYNQSAEGLSEAEILEMIDHHKLGNICTSKPINFRNMPVGSTCTIVYQMFQENNIDIPYKIAGVLLSGIISDTLFFRSPTTTPLDRQCVQNLNKIVGLNLDQYAMDMFKAGTSLEGQSIDEIFYKDFKEFAFDNYKAGIGQVFTLAVEDVLNRKEEFLEYMDTVHQNKEYFLTLLIITDIMKEGSYLLFRCNHQYFISTAFGIDAFQGIFAKDILSRKKQVVPKISEAFQSIK